jgi:hypothetical protein
LRGIAWRFIARFEARYSVNKTVGGLWVGISTADGSQVGTSEEEFELHLRPVEEALSLIKTYDRVRYDRLGRDLERVWVQLLFGPRGRFNRSLNRCELDTRFVIAQASSPEMIASVIVHEATHARLSHCGFGYGEELRPRVEAICVRRELAFARRLPHGDRVREWAEAKLKWCEAPDHLTDAARDDEFVKGGIEALHYAEAPAWMLRATRVLLTVGVRVKRYVRWAKPRR